MAEKYYLCRPEGMIDTVATALKNRGTGDEAIFLNCLLPVLLPILIPRLPKPQLRQK